MCWANAEEAVWYGKPEYEIGVALFYEAHSARINRGSLRFGNAKVRISDIDRCQPTGTPTHKVTHES